MKMTLVRIALALPMLIGSASCGDNTSNPKPVPPSTLEAKEALDDHDSHDGHKDENSGHEDDDHGHEEGGEHVELSAEEAEAAGIRVAVVQTGPISGALELPAEIRFDADRVARISPNVEGVVARLHVGEGDTVEAGATLALLSSRELAGLNADYLNALSTERLALAELRREEQLWKQKITSQADVQSARAGHSAAKAAREAAENRLHAVGVSHDVLDHLDEAEDGALSQSYVTTPIAGRVIRRSISLGETVSSGGEAMFVIIDDSVVWADIAVYKEDLGKVEDGLPVSLRQDGGRTVAQGTISTVLPVIDETSRTATARVVIDNSEHRLKPGQFVTARINTGDAQSVVRVPSDTIVSVENRSSVFVPTEDGFEAREVRAGASADGYTEIVSGLQAGEAFVSEGAFTLKAQLEKDAFGDDHDH